MTLGEKILNERKKKKLTQNELSIKSGVAVRTIKAIENNEISSFTFGTIGRIAWVLGLSLDELWKISMNI